MSKHTYKEAYGWLALGGVLVIALGAALFYHHGTKQFGRTPAQATQERGKSAVVCGSVGTSREWTLGLLNDTLQQQRIEVSAKNPLEALRVKNPLEADYLLVLSKPFKVSAPSVSVVMNVGGDNRRWNDFQACVTVTEE